MSQLLIGAFFFAMHSCEYCKTAGIKWTKILTLRNICYCMECHKLSPLDPDLTHANSVSITFEYQKHDKRNDRIMQHWTGDPFLCPICQWGAIIHCIHTYPGSCDNMPVNTILSSQKSTPADDKQHDAQQTLCCSNHHQKGWAWLWSGRSWSSFNLQWHSHVDVPHGSA